MKKTTYNEADLGEFFKFAEDKFGVSWNECCDMFHRSEILNYHGVTDFELEELEGDLADPDWPYGDNEDGDNVKYEKANEILIAFAKENKVTEFRIA